MSRQNDQISKLFTSAIAGGYAVSGETIVQLREKSEKEITTLKLVFWVAIGLFNLMVWYPFSTPVPAILRWGVGIGALAIASLFPVFGIRRHRRILHQLEECSRGPKRSKADSAGQVYMDRVRRQGRYFVRAEYEILQGEPPVEN